MNLAIKCLLLLGLCLSGLSQPTNQINAQDGVGQILDMDWSSDGVFLATGHNTGIVRVLNVTTTVVELLHVGETISAVSWNPLNNRELAFADLRSDIGILELDTGNVRRSFAGDEITTHLAWSPDSHSLASAGQSGSGIVGEYTVRIWDPSTGELLKVFSDLPDVITGVAWNPTNANLLAAVSASGHIIIWNIETGSEELIVNETDHQFRSLTWRPDGTQLAVTASIIDQLPPEGGIIVQPDALEIYSLEGILLSTFRRDLLFDALWITSDVLILNDRGQSYVLDANTGQASSTLGEARFIEDFAISTNGILAYGLSGRSGTVETVLVIPDIPTALP